MIRLARGGALWLLGVVALLTAGCYGLAEPEGWAPPAFQDDLALVFGDDSRLTAVDLESGAVRWFFPDDVDPEQRDLDIDAMYAQPIVTDDAVFVATFSAGIFALDPEDGTIIWRFAAVDGNVVGTPAFLDDRLIVATTHGRVYALTSEGDIAPGWPEPGLDVGEGVWARVITLDDTIIVATMEGHVRAIDATDASLVPGWEFEAGGAVPDLALLDDVLFVPSFDRHVYLLDASTGEPRNPEGFVTSAWVWHEPAFDGERAYFGDLEGNVYGLNIESGEADWTTVLSGEPKIKAAPALVDGTLVVVDRDRSAALIDPASGELRARFPVPIDGGTVRAPLRVVDGGVFMTTTHGDLWRIDPEERAAEQVTREDQT